MILEQHNGISKEQISDWVAWNSNFPQHGPEKSMQGLQILGLMGTKDRWSISLLDPSNWIPLCSFSGTQWSWWCGTSSGPSSAENRCYVVLLPPGAPVVQLRGNRNAYSVFFFFPYSIQLLNSNSNTTQTVYNQLPLVVYTVHSHYIATDCTMWNLLIWEKNGVESSVILFLIRGHRPLCVQWICGALSINQSSTAGKPRSTN